MDRANGEPDEVMSIAAVHGENWDTPNHENGPGAGFRRG